MTGPTPSDPNNLLPGRAERALLPPAQARELFRSGLRVPTAGWCAGRAQANLIALPREWAFELLLFAQRNPKPCPVLDVLEPGQVSSAIFVGDVRTDLPGYRVFRDGRLVDEPTAVADVWRDDLVALLIGCSFTFESALDRNGIGLRHVEMGRTVPMYRTSVSCRPAGRLSGPLVVSMRPVPADRVADAVRISGRYPAVHGAPVHIGNPAALGIADLDRPDFGEPVEMRPGELPVFWACGVTPQAAVMASRPPFAITHSPGQMAVLDARDEDYLV